MVADVGVLARALNPNGLLGKGRIYFYDRSTESVAKKSFDSYCQNYVKMLINHLCDQGGRSWGALAPPCFGNYLVNFGNF